ncbi:uncharacterized protein [Oscarella lobularis]
MIIRNVDGAVIKTLIDYACKGKNLTHPTAESTYYLHKWGLGGERHRVWLVRHSCAVRRSAASARELEEFSMSEAESTPQLHAHLEHHYSRANSLAGDQLHAEDEKLDVLLAKEGLTETRNEHDETILHYATSSLLSTPLAVLCKLVKESTTETVNARDLKGFTALDRLMIDDEPLTAKILDIFHQKQANFLESWEDMPSPIIRLVKRKDGHEHVEQVLRFYDTAKPLLQYMWPSLLRATLHGGTARTLQILLDYETEQKMQTYGLSLLHAALTCDVDLEDKIGILLKRCKRQGDFLNELDAEGRNCLHALADCRPPEIRKAIEALLKKGKSLQKEDVAKQIAVQDKQGDTPLHKAVKNYAQRNAENDYYVEALKTLTDFSPDFTVRNKHRLTALQCLLQMCNFTPSDDVILMFLGGFLIEEDPELVVNPHEHYPLADLAKRSDGSCLFLVILKAVSDKRIDKVQLEKHYEYMFEAAVQDGTRDMMECLLNHGYEAASSDLELLAVQAASSLIDPDLKLTCLSDLMDKTHRETMREWQLLHIISGRESPSVNALKIAIYQYKCEAETKDAEEYTALHLAAANPHEGSLECLKYLLNELDGDLASLKEPNTPLGSLLNALFEGEDESPLPLEASRKVILLLENGIDFKSLESDLAWLCDESSSSRNTPKPTLMAKLFLDPDVITAAKNPIRFLVTIGKFCKDNLRRIKKKTATENRRGLVSQKLHWKSLNKSLEAEAISLVTEFGKNEREFKDVMTEKELILAEEIAWNEFMSQKCVGKCLQEIFKGHTTGKEDEDIENSVYKRWRWRERLEQSRHTRLELVYLLLLLFGFLVQTLLLPILLPCYLLYQRFSSKQDDGHWRHWLPFPPGEIPFVTWYANAVGYLGFVGILIARSSTVEKEDSMTILDWIVIVYVVALVCQELRQIIIERRQYLRRPSNWFDMVTLLTLVVGYAVRHEGFARGKLTAVQASEFILGFATIFACLRLLSYVKLHQRIGPILISFGSITRDVIYFLVIFGVFLLAFSAGIAGIFRGSLYSETMEPAPRAVHGLRSSMVTLFWSLFGMIDYSDLSQDVGDTHVLTIETTVGLFVFGVWLLVSIIVLLNMLIALVNSALDEVQKNRANLVWHRSYLSAIQQMREYYPFPFPMNIFQFLADLVYLIRHLFPLCNNQESVRKEGYQITFSVGKTEKSLSQLVVMKEAYLKRASRMQTVAEDNSKEMEEKVKQLESSLWKLEANLVRRFKPIFDETCVLARKHAGHLCKTTETEQSLTEASSAKGNLSTLKSNPRSSFLVPQESVPDLPDGTFSESILPLTCQNNEYPDCRSYVILNTSVDDNKKGCFRDISSPITRETIFNFEVEIVDWGRHGYILIGLTPEDYPQEAAPGWLEGSIGYHADDGRFFVENGKGVQVSSPCEEGDIVGCRAHKGRVSFYRRRESHVDNVCETQDGQFEFPSVLYPSVALQSGREKIKLTLDVPSQFPEASDSSRDLHCARVEFQAEDNAYKLLYKSDKHNQVGICRGAKPVDKESFFEVELIKRGERGCITIGLTTKEYPFNKQPGWSSDSIGFLVFDGKLLKGKERGAKVCRGCKEGDTIVCRIATSSRYGQKTTDVKFVRRRGRRTKELFSTTFEPETAGAEFYPTVGMHSKGEEARIYLPGHSFPKETNTQLKRCDIAKSSRHQELRVHGNCICYVDDGFRSVETWQPDCTGLSGGDIVTFEVKIITLGETSDISVGFGPNNGGEVYLPGWTKNSMAFHCRDGLLYHGSCCGRRRLGAPAKAKDVIRAELSREDEDNVLTIFKNGMKLTPEPLVIPYVARLYPTIGMRSKGAVAIFSMKIDSRNGEETTESKPTFFSDSHNIELHEFVAISSGDGHEKGSCQVLEPFSDTKHFFELEILSMGDEGNIYIGVAEMEFSCRQLPGFVPGSVGYCCKTGEIFQGNGRGGKRGQRGYEGTKITVEISQDDSEKVVFKRNDIHMQELDTKLRKTSSNSNWHLTVGMISNGEAVRLIN